MSATSNMTPAIDSKLRGLRRSVRSWYFVHGISRMMWWMVVLISADLLLDYNTRMDLPQRVICLGVFVIVLAAVAFRQLLRPLAQSMNDDTLVARVESQHDELGDSVISAVQFARAKHTTHAQGVSQTMIDATIDQGIVAASRVNFRDVLDRSTFQKNLLVLVLFAVLIGLGAYAVANTIMMRTWFERNVLLGDAQWPQDTYLTIDGVIDGNLVLPRGDDWEQAVKAKGVVPSVVYLEYRPEGGRTLTQQMTQRGERQFVSMFKNMLEPFRFRVYGGDSITPWISVDLVDRPSLDSFELTLTPPKYTGIEPQVVWSIGTKSAGDDTKHRGTSAVYALKGSSLSIKGTANKKLSKARMRLGSEKTNLPISAENSFVINITPKQLAAGSYSIDLTDGTGLESKRPTRFTVRVKQDRDPGARVKLNGIGSMIVPWALVPVGSTLTDDYAINSAKLKYQWRGESDESPKGEGEQAFDQLGEELGKKRIEYMHPFDVKPLEVPIGSFLTFHVEATDNDTISGPKAGQSTTFFVKVVSEQDLRTELLRREQEQRQEFERMIRNQEVLLADTQSVLAEVRGKPKLTDDHEHILVKAHKQQRLMAMRCKAIAEHFQQIKAEVDNNRLEDEGGPIQRRVQTRIIDPLRQLASEWIPTAADHLDKGRKSPNDTVARDKALTDAERAQQRVAAEMRQVLKHMVKWEGYQEAVNLALEVFSAQQQVNEATRLEIQRRVQGIFGDDDKKK